MGERAGVGESSGFLEARRNRQVADPFARDRHRFRPAPGQHGAVDQGQRVGRRHRIVNDRAIRLVADGEQRIADDRIQFAQYAGRIEPPGGIVGRIEDQRLGARRHGGGDAVRIGQEVGGGFHRDHAAAVVFDIKAILGKTRIKNDDFVAGVENRLEHGVDGAGRAAGHDEMLRGEGKAGGCGQAPRQLRADFRVARVGHVAVGMWEILFDHAAQCADHRRGRFHFRIAQAEIEDVFGAAFAAKLDADFKHAANPTGSLELPGYGLRDRHECVRLWRTHSCVPRRDSSRRLCALGQRASA